MSVENAQAFITKVQADEGLRSEVIALGYDYEGLIQLAGKRGYSFTADELKTAAQDNGYNIGQTIKEEDLSAVAGGTFHATGGGDPLTTSWTRPGCC